MNFTQQRFIGYQSTPLLWENDLHDLVQLSLTTQAISIKEKINETIRLGNYVERLVSLELQQNKSIEILAENIQIIENKATLGEIDCLLLENKTPVHLEIAYKFYLYDQSVGSTPLEHWIGPNRRDSLLLKLNKLKNKQFPLIHHKACEPLLNQFKIQQSAIKQKLIFKAQLFIPYNQTIDVFPLNNKAVSGYFMNSNQLRQFENCKFYIPKKLDWIISPHTNINWLNYNEVKEQLLLFHQKKSAPLLWVKKPNGELLKIFVVWW